MGIEPASFNPPPPLITGIFSFNSMVICLLLSCVGPKISFQLYLRLALLMGLTWISGVVAGGLDLEPVWYVFLVLNTLQVRMRGYTENAQLERK